MPWRERLARLADATGTSPVRLAVGAAAVALAGLGALWLLRPPPPPAEVALPFASTTDPVTPSTSSTEEPPSLLVHVAGAVVAPGVYEIPAGGRVVDAIAAASGLRPDADHGRINLAALVTDGQRVYVPVAGEEPPVVAVGGTDTDGSGPGTGGTTGGPVDLNTADAAALETLPGIGPATAAAIIEHRQRVGGFSSVDQLLDVRGIGPAKLEAIRELVTV